MSRNCPVADSAGPPQATSQARPCRPTHAPHSHTHTHPPSGDDYADGFGKGTSCFPYQLPECSHHEPGKYAPCASTEYPTPKCPVQEKTGCTETGYATAWADDKHHAKSGYNLNSNKDIQVRVCGVPCARRRARACTGDVRRAVCACLSTVAPPDQPISAPFLYRMTS